MSQAKVDRYKEQKKHRKQEVKKQHMKKVAIRLAGVLVCAALAVWIGFSAYNRYQSNLPIETTQVNLDSVQNYLDALE